VDVDDERSGCDGEAFSMPAGEGSETDHSEGRSKRQKEKERGGEGAKRKIKQRPIKLARLRVDAHIRVRPSSKEIQLRGGRIRAASVLGGGIASRDHVRLTTSRGLNSGGWAAWTVRGEGQRAVRK